MMPGRPVQPRRNRAFLYVILGIAALVALIAIIAVGSSGGTSKTETQSVPAAKDSTAAAGPSPAAPSKAPPFKPETLLDVKGTGAYTTHKFTAGGKGDYDVYWSYKADPAINMGVFDFFAYNGDGASDMNAEGPNVDGPGDRGITHVYNDPGTHYLQVNATNGWTLKVVTAG